MSESATPMMAQYFEIKSRHPDSILLFRMGDFFEMFFDDARVASEILGLTLTTRGKHCGEPIPMAGVPWHSADAYVSRLLEAGRRVAMCDQVEDARKAKGLVRRAVTEVITAGTVLPAEVAGPAENRFIAAVYLEGGLAGLALADVTTGDLLAGELPSARLTDELERFRPVEILLPPGSGFVKPKELEAVVTTATDAWSFSPQRAVHDLAARFGTPDLSGFGCADLTTGAGAAGGLLAHLTALKGGTLGHFSRMRRLSPSDELFLDAASLRHLEVLEAPPGGRSLVQAVDHTRTAMGRRFLRQALARPLRHVPTILARQRGVACFAEDPALAREVGEVLSATPDVERLAARLGTGRASPRDLAALAATLARLPALQAALAPADGRLHELAGAIDALPVVRADLEAALADDPPAQAGQGGVFRPGYSERLDAIERSQADARAWIAGLQESERRRTGIASLRVGFNRVFGYYIEVTRANLASVPAEYERRQTLVGSERFVTQPLKENEAIVLGAEERLHDLEIELFDELRARVALHLPSIMDTARALGEIDCLHGLAELAIARDYVRPHVHEGTALEIRGGRHPVVEQLLPPGRFIPNDCQLDPDRRQILLITGPNMAGKSTYLRQVGLIALLAQAGSYVPAQSASIGVADRLFTRVGASDNIARGQSTFLVEMNESANILHNATARSLVLLDEVGRGTSTFDGLSIAWAMTEHLHDGMSGAPRTLFATHFHELTELATRLPRVVNLRVEVKEWGDEVVFLHEIREGKADRSYGIHVARMAGLPAPVLTRARVILAELENGGASGTGRRGAEQLLFALTDPGRRAASPPAGGPAGPAQDPRSGAGTAATQGPRVERAIAERLRALDLDRMTPLDALAHLAALRELAEESES